jgi:hypothetical protein
LQACVPVCLTSVGATDDCHMVEIETVLMPITFGAPYPERFIGVAQILTDVLPLAGRAIRFERLVSAELVREGEPATPAPPSPNDRWLPHPRAPHLRLVLTGERAAGDKEPRHLNDTLKTLLGYPRDDGKHTGGV